MRCEVRRRSHRDGSRWASLLRCRGGGSAPFTYPLGLLPFERNLQGFSIPDHPVRNRVALVPLGVRDGLHALLVLLWPPSIRARSRGGLARRGLPRALTFRLCGELPRHVHPSAVGPCLRTPPRCRRLSRCRWRNLHRLSACALGEASRPIRGPIRSRLAGGHELSRVTG